MYITARSGAATDRRGTDHRQTGKHRDGHAPRRSHRRPAPSDSAGAFRRCQGCFRLRRCPPGQLPSASTGPLRRADGGGLSPPQGSRAPRGAPHRPTTGIFGTAVAQWVRRQRVCGTRTSPKWRSGTDEATRASPVAEHPPRVGDTSHSRVLSQTARRQGPRLQHRRRARSRDNRGARRGPVPDPVAPR